MLYDGMLPFPSGVATLTWWTLLAAALRVASIIVGGETGVHGRAGGATT